MKIHYRGNKQLHRYLYNGWRLSSELRLKILGRKIIMYLTFTKDFEIGYDPDNVVAVDVNEDNVTLALFRNRKLCGIYRVETGLGRLVIAYSERRRRIMKGESTKTRRVRKALRRFREGRWKHNIIYKTARIIKELAVRNNSVVVIGNVYKGKKKFAERTRKNSLRHRIHQWSVSMLTRILNDKPVHVVEVSEANTSTADPYTRGRVRHLTPSMRIIEVRRERRIRVVKIKLRPAMLSNGLILDRNIIGAVNIGLRYLPSDGSLVALGSTEPHVAGVKQVNPYQGLTPHRNRYN